MKMDASLKVLLNTVALYIKLFITFLVGLCLTRIVLNRLGVEDYGIYNLIGGVISLFSFLQTALSVSTQRYLSVSMGKNDQNLVNTIFASSLAIHLILSIIVLIVLELCSLFIFNGFLNIPDERVEAAKIVYHIMALSTFFTILQVPYTADMTAHEDLWLLAIIESVCALLKLSIIFLFKWSSIDALILYSSWLFIVTILSFLPKFIWSVYKYKECKLIHSIKFVKTDTIREMIGFTGWNAFGTLALVGRNQGVAILQNIFLGPAINAVYGISNQLNGHLIYCSQIMTTSVTPQIMKSEGEGNRSRMLRLSIFISKMAFFVSSILALPLMIEFDSVLNFWLKDVPEFTQIYCILILCMFLVMQLYPGLTRAVQAIGMIKKYQLVTSVLLLLPIPIGYAMYKCGGHHTYVLYFMILSQILQMIYTIWYIHRYTGVSMRNFYVFIIKAISIFISVYLLGDLLHDFLLLHIPVLSTFFVTCSCTVLLFSVLAFAIVFNNQERESILSTLKLLIKRR